MNCPIHDRKQLAVVLGDVAGTLTSGEQASFERHMADCAECRRLVEEQQAAWTALDEWQAPAVSEDFDRKLYARIAAQEQLPWWKRQWNALAHPAAGFSWKPAVPVSLACVALCAAFLIHDSAGTHAALPAAPAAAPTEQDAQKVDINQVEHALDDMDMLNQLGAGAGS